MATVEHPDDPPDRSEPCARLRQRITAWMMRHTARRYDEVLIDLRDGRAEQTGMPDASVDAVVSSLVLCGVPDVDATLAEVLRVLRPGGTFAVLEHVAAPPGTALRAIQRACSRPWRAMFEGCHPDRDTGVAIERAGFVDIALERIDGPVPIPSRPDRWWETGV